MTNPATFVRLLGSIREHLTAFPLTFPLVSVYAGCDQAHGEHVTMHLAAARLADLADALLGWADTLTSITVTAWRPPHGQTVHLTLTGQLHDSTHVIVFGGVLYCDTTFGDLQPEGRQGVAFSVLRFWAAGDTAVAA
jgi:hypothetical protein